MMFEQRLAGNAVGTHTMCFGTPVKLLMIFMRRRSSLHALLFALCALVLTPAAAHADDPLLSGYAGPGAGEQLIQRAG